MIYHLDQDIRNPVSVAVTDLSGNGASADISQRLFLTHTFL